MACNCGKRIERAEALLRHIETALMALVSDTKRQTEISTAAMQRIQRNAAAAIAFTELREIARADWAAAAAAEGADDPIRPGALH